MGQCADDGEATGLRLWEGQGQSARRDDSSEEQPHLRQGPRWQPETPPPPPAPSPAQQSGLESSRQAQGDPGFALPQVSVLSLLCGD